MHQCRLCYKKSKKNKREMDSKLNINIPKSTKTTPLSSATASPSTLSHNFQRNTVINLYNEENSLIDEDKSSLIVVSNRLPVTVEKTTIPRTKSYSPSNLDASSKLFSPDRQSISSFTFGKNQTASPSPVGSKFRFKKSSGGLVTALTGVNKKFLWIGWLGTEINEPEDQEQIQQVLLEQHNCRAVFLNEEDANLYYNQFCNGVLWPLFHYVMSSKDTALLQQESYDAYVRVNQHFAEEILKVYKPGDYVWIHDYHLMLVPKMLREKIPNIKVSFFLHIPFPSSEIYRTLAFRSELLQGLLACNLVGFHTHNFVRHFLSSCTRTLGLDTKPEGMDYNGIFVSCSCFPIGINPLSFIDGVKDIECRRRMEQFEKQFEGKYILLGIDRLDPTKGVDLKLLAYERFLQMHPELANKVVLIQVGVPSREAVEQYKALISQINETVGRINSQFGTLEGYPVLYINKSVNFADLCALYAVADALIVSSIRDGMNLVCQEYIAVQQGKSNEKDPGVVILSEFAGASVSLGGSIIVNPWNIEQTAKAMYDALTMSSEAKTVRHSQNFAIISKYTASKWCSDFMKSFKVATSEQLSQQHLTSALPTLKKEVFSSKFFLANKRLLLLDYDGTIVDINRYPSLVTPSEQLLQALDRLTSDERNIVYVISGRSKQSLMSALGHIKGIGLCCEHGVFVRHPHSAEFVSLYGHLDLDWLSSVATVVEFHEQRCPGSQMERKESTIVFHYRNADPDFGQHQANELKLHLEMAYSTLPADIVPGYSQKLLEIRPMGVSKGHCVAKLLSVHENVDFLFGCGDDVVDEEIFEALIEIEEGKNEEEEENAFNSPKKKPRKFIKKSQQAKECITCLIANQTVKATRAQYRLESPHALVDVLSYLASHNSKQS